MRTIPPFLVALVAISLLTDQLMTGDFFRYVFYVQNAFAQHNVQDYFAVAWSLSVEEWFYVIFPTLAFVLARVFRQSDLNFFIFVAAAFICIITAFRMIYGVTQNWDELVRRIVDFRIDSIAYGFLLYVMMQRFGEGWTEKPRTSAQLLTFAIFVACTLVGFYVTSRAITAGYVVSQHIFPFIAAAFGMSAILAFYMLDSTFKTRRISSFCLYFGRISYSVYLFHVMLILLMRPALQQLPIAVQICIYVGGCVIFSTLFFYYFEKPILAARPKYKLA
jgi:peptidoglycan/LPS O-acetylase OafA/YrhL